MAQVYHFMRWIELKVVYLELGRKAACIRRSVAHAASVVELSEYHKEILRLQCGAETLVLIFSKRIHLRGAWASNVGKHRPRATKIRGVRTYVAYCRAATISTPFGVC